MIQIDKEKCIGCGACKRDCPADAIKIREGKAEVFKDCLHCGHCVAVCPVNAAAIPEYDMAEVEAYEKEKFTLDADHYLRAVKFRRSIRSYTPEKIGRETAERILNAGRYTATARNRQACTYVFIQDRLDEFKELVWKEIPSIVENLRESAPEYARTFEYFYLKWKRSPEDDTFFFNTPAFLVIASDNPLDGGLAAANIENMAVAEGLGALYSGYMMRVIGASQALRDWLQTGEKKISCCMLLGYPAVSYKRTAPRRKADIIWK